MILEWLDRWVSEWVSQSATKLAFFSESIYMLYYWKLALSTRSILQGESLSPIYLNGVNLEYVDSFKYLGVVVDAKLNIKSHYSELLKNVNRKVQYFERASNNLNMNTRIKVYRTIISPVSLTVLQYYILVLRRILISLQNRCLRIIL